MCYFYNAIGYGGLMLSKFAKRLQDECERIIKPEVEPTPDIDAISLPITTKPKNVKSDSGIVVDAFLELQIEIAKKLPKKRHFLEKRSRHCPAPYIFHIILPECGRFSHF